MRRRRRWPRGREEKENTGEWPWRREEEKDVMAMEDGKRRKLVAIKEGLATSMTLTIHVSMFISFG